MNTPIYIQVPSTGQQLTDGCKIKLSRFESESWILHYGWFEFGGNRPFCGWYLVNEHMHTIKPLQLPDMDDIYLIEY